MGNNAEIVWVCGKEMHGCPSAEVQEVGYVWFYER